MIWTKQLKCPVCFSDGAVLTREELTCTAKPVDVTSLMVKEVMLDLSEIVSTKTYKELICHITNVELTVDLFSASAIETVYKALSTHNKIKFVNTPLMQMQKFAMSFL